MQSQSTVYTQVGKTSSTKDLRLGSALGRVSQSRRLLLAQRIGVNLSYNACPTGVLPPLILPYKGGK
ncbi:hypothetical protein [Nostoc sp.]|uniref:hypothetical protein n=1 Tax=Nostoc sp. TaxID=1180 RepID=UPI002FF6BD32